MSPFNCGTRIRSDAAKRKDANKMTDDGYPVQSLRTLLDDLGTLARNTIRTNGDPPAEFTMLTQPTRLQKYAFQLLKVKLSL